MYIFLVTTCQRHGMLDCDYLLREKTQKIFFDMTLNSKPYKMFLSLIKPGSSDHSPLPCISVHGFQGTRRLSALFSFLLFIEKPATYATGATQVKMSYYYLRMSVWVENRATVESTFLLLKHGCRAVLMGQGYWKHHTDT